MRTLLQNVLAILAGIFLGSLVNFAIILVGPMVIPLPEGIDLTDMEQFAENLKRLPPQNFVAPWLAHALGTLTGSAVASRLSASHPMAIAMGISAFFLLGGIGMVAGYGGPVAFAIADLGGAYAPMGLLGGWLGRSHARRAAKQPAQQEDRSAESTGTRSPRR